MPPGKGPASSRQRGSMAELQAMRFLQGCGLNILHRNYRWRGGEIDLIAQDGPTLCFVEVRFRHRPDRGSALCTVDARKQARLVRAAEHFLAHTWQSGACPCRFDVVAIEEGMQLTWVRDAFRTTWVPDTW
ncbi:MAG: YraN family protein [Myxococcota bacterium]|nr:YraN family protein [Myxococcota bacterium]